MELVDLLSAASYLSRAADDLRAAGLTLFAAEIDALLAILDAELAHAEGLPSLDD